MRKRHQKGGLRETGKSWVAQWWEDGHRRSKVLGRTSEMTKSEAKRELARIVELINDNSETSSRPMGFCDFVEQIFFPWARGNWKRSTAGTTEARIRLHLCREFQGQPLKSFTRSQLQDYLQLKSELGLARSTVTHLRWDLRQIFGLGVADDFIEKNPADLLYIPKMAHRPPSKTMNWKEVKLIFPALDLRERLIVGLALVAGMRPGEIFALQWQHITDECIIVCQRVYRGEIDTPKSPLSNRNVALSDGLRRELQEWRSKSIDTKPEAWVFPSERGTPISRDNFLRRNIHPRLATVGLGWVDFQVMRRTHSSLMNKLEIDPKLVADQLGHTLDVNLNVYTHSDVECRQSALNQFENVLLGLTEQTH